MYQNSNFVLVLHMKHEKKIQNVGSFSKIAEIFSTIYQGMTCDVRSQVASCDVR